MVESAVWGLEKIGVVIPTSGMQLFGAVCLTFPARGRMVTPRLVTRRLLMNVMLAPVSLTASCSCPLRRMVVRYTGPVANFAPLDTAALSYLTTARLAT